MMALVLEWFKRLLQGCWESLSRAIAVLFSRAVANRATWRGARLGARVSFSMQWMKLFCRAKFRLLIT